MKLAIALLSNVSETDIQVYCDHLLIGDKSFYEVMDFTGSDLKIGEGFDGEMRHFKLFVANLGKETFSRNTVGKPPIR